MKEFMGKETISHEIIWKVKFNFKEKNHQGSKQYIESLHNPGCRSWDNTYSSLFLFNKCVP